MSEASNEATVEAASFAGKWRARWPEWGIARVFVPAGQRELAEHWFALLQEWTDAATTAEPAPGLAKLAWWQEELRGWAKGARRHPLGARLQKLPLDWTMLAMALPALSRHESGFDDAGVQGLARAISDAEQVLFDEARDGRLAIESMLDAALARPAGRHEPRDGTRPRRILAALADARAAIGNGPVPPLRTVRCSWNAARARGPG